MFRKLFHHLSRPQPADTGNPKSRSLYCPVPLTLAMVQERAAQQHKQKNSRKLQLVRLHSAFATQLDQLAQTTTDLASTCAALPTFPAAAPLPSLFAPLYSVSQCGTRAYLKRSELDLLSSCSALLEELRLQLCLSPEDFNRLIMPLLQALARNVSVVPASQGHHDVQNGGLLRHSLLCALCAVSTAAHSEAFGTLTAERGELPAASPESATLALCALASVCTVGLYLLQIVVLRYVSAFTMNLTYNLEPIYSIAAAMLLFSENRELNFSFYCGLCFIAMSVILQTASLLWESRAVT